MKRSLMVVASLVLAAAGAGLVSGADVPEKSVTGNLLDSFCYTTMGAHGASHQKCALACAKKGIPVALKEKGSDKLYVLMPKKNAEPLPDEVLNKMEEEVTVTGHEYSSGGATFLTVDSVK